MPQEIISAECVQDHCRDWLTAVKAEIMRWHDKPPAQNIPVGWREEDAQRTGWDPFIEECFKRHFRNHFTSSPYLNNYFQRRENGAFQGFTVSSHDDVDLCDLLSTAMFLCRTNSLQLIVPKKNTAYVSFYIVFITTGRKTSFCNTALRESMGKRSSPSSLLRMPMKKQDGPRVSLGVRTVSLWSPYLPQNYIAENSHVERHSC